ncbi:MAG: M3 family oligoendopeptidase [Ignavibacteria bacterium]|nr:M3 family oligoendopeptidase [Ignavibacteria bacterium]
MKLSEIPYERPDLEQLQSHYKDLLSRFTQATNPTDQITVLDEWNSLRIDLATLSNLVYIRFSQNIKDEWAKAEKDFFDQNGPTIHEWDIQLIKEIVKSPYIEEIKKQWGELFVEKLEMSLQTFIPDIKDELIEESKLTQRYAEIFASAKIEFDGETYNLSSLEPKILSTDRNTRKRAQQTRFGFIGSHAEELDSLYQDLVKTRTSAAKKLGFNSYTELAYKELGRTEYNPEMIAGFRDQISRVVVPLVHEFKKDQSSRLGLDYLTFFDEGLLFADGNPNPQGEPDWIVDQASAMYKELSPVTDTFFSMMRENEILDLVTRPNKSVGGYCSSFPKYGIPFIFSNFNGTTHDVEVLTHEAGHALQNYLSSKHKPLEYRWPSYEAAEIHSMSMEYITWPWMKNFFGDQTNKFKYAHLVKSIQFLPYACAVDEFQHWVYDNPEAQPKERLEFWKTMEKKYLPWRAYEDMPEGSEGRVWQFQSHIYRTPFYYIDYALAQICALQFWVKSRENKEEAMKDYLHICEIGGSKTFLDIVKSGNLKSPFASNTIQDIIQVAREWISEHTPQFS